MNIKLHLKSNVLRLAHMYFLLAVRFVIDISFYNVVYARNIEKY